MAIIILILNRSISPSEQGREYFRVLLRRCLFQRHRTQLTQFFAFLEENSPISVKLINCIVEALAYVFLFDLWLIILITWGSHVAWNLLAASRLLHLFLLYLVIDYLVFPNIGRCRRYATWRRTGVLSHIFFRPGRARSCLELAFLREFTLPSHFTFRHYYLFSWAIFSMYFIGQV